MALGLTQCTSQSLSRGLFALYVLTPPWLSELISIEIFSLLFYSSHAVLKHPCTPPSCRPLQFLFPRPLMLPLVNSALSLLISYNLYPNGTFSVRPSLTTLSKIIHVLSYTYAFYPSILLHFIFIALSTL